MNLGAVITLAAIAGASALAGMRSGDRFWRGLAVTLAVVGVSIGIRIGVDTTSVVGTRDELVMVVGGLLFAGSIVLQGGLPRSIESHLLLGSRRPEWAFDRDLAEARRPFLAAAATAAEGGGEGLAEEARWRRRLPRRPPTAAWAALAERLEAVDREWLELRERDETLAWTAQSDQATAEWAGLRAPLLARRDFRQRLQRRFARILLALSAACVVAGALHVATGLASLPPGGRAPNVPVAPAGRTVAFAPLGAFPVGELERLQAFYEARYGLAIEILAATQVPADLEDQTRMQFGAEDLIDYIAGAIPGASDPDRVVIGFIAADIYFRGRPDWRWAFGGRSDGHLGIVSTARMAAVQGLFGDLLESARLRKMVTRDIGVLYFGLPLSTDRGSVLYQDILGVPDLDAIGEDF